MKAAGLAGALVLFLAVSSLHTNFFASARSTRNLQQEFSSASAVSVSGGNGPNGNCGSTNTVGNAQAFASGPPCPNSGGNNPVVQPPPFIPAPPPSTTCPAIIYPVAWANPGPYTPINVCPGSTISFRWNTAVNSASTVTYSLYQIPSSTCPSSQSGQGVQLITSPATSPNPSGAVNTTISVPGTYYFTDFNGCSKGHIQQVIISPTTPPAVTSATGSSSATSG